MAVPPLLHCAAVASTSDSQPVHRARISAHGAARLSHGHPWVYRADLLRAPAEEPGVVALEGPHGEPLGWAFWSPRSQISLRWLAPAEVDPPPPDPRFWRRRLEEALAYRQSLEIDATAYRIVHAEADGFPSIIVDRYGDYLVLQTLSAGAERVRDLLTRELVECLRPSGILARNDPPVRTHEALPREVVLLHGEVPKGVEVREGSARYLAAVWDGQKTGAFLDQRENRIAVRALARGRALDAFCYHGLFALHLAAAGADEVVALDSSAAAIARTRENAERNGMGALIRAHEANVFDFLRAELARGARYDVIVLDPPAFAKTRAALPRATAAYKEINLRSLELLAPGGHLFTASCSYHLRVPDFLRMLRSACEDSGRRVRLCALRGQAADHPVVLTIPETWYLKAAILQATD